MVEWHVSNTSKCEIRVQNGNENLLNRSSGPLYHYLLSSQLQDLCLFFLSLSLSVSLKKLCRAAMGTQALAVLFIPILMISLTKAQPLVPALFIFGDSVVDVGNNNDLSTLIKADFPPYGRDFTTHQPTGRFCNGKLATDFTAENLGFTSHPPAYLSREATGKKLLIGANFASAASGYYDLTAKLYHAISLPQQLDNYKEYQNKVAAIAGKDKAAKIISGGIYLVSAGSSDFVQNYYIDPLLNKIYTPDEFSDLLIQSYTNFIQVHLSLIYQSAAITIFGSDSNNCVTRLNNDAISFNKKLNATSQALEKKFSGLKLVVFDIYQSLYKLVTKPDL